MRIRKSDGSVVEALIFGVDGEWQLFAREDKKSGWNERLASSREEFQEKGLEVVETTWREDEKLKRLGWWSESRVGL